MPLFPGPNPSPMPEPHSPAPARRSHRLPAATPATGESTTDSATPDGRRVPRESWQSDCASQGTCYFYEDVADQNVGAGLLAKAMCQRQMFRLIRRIREQAPTLIQGASGVSG